MSDEKFKLPQSSYEELTKVIKAYGHFSEPAALDEVSKFIGLHKTIISRNVGFLIGLGILEAGAKKVPTTNGKSLAHALEHDIPDEVQTWWRQIVSENDFLTRLLAAIRIRNGMDQQTLEAHIAYSAGQPKKPQFMTGARTVIDILRAADLIQDVNGKYIAPQDLTALSEVTITGETPSVATADNIPQKEVVSTVLSSTPPAVQSGIAIRIQININCTAAEVPSVGQHIKGLVEELSASGSKAESEEERSE